MTTPRDSLSANRAARRAQSAFESRRRHLLPRSLGGSGGRCDVRIGRFCYWHDDGDLKPPDEPPSIARARDEFLSRLDSAGSIAPRDGWIAGQRVRYLVEGGRLAEAAVVARGCEAARWWCASLTGFALHAADDAAGADSAYAAALAAMPDEQRCSWEDIDDLLPGRASGRYRQLPCDERRRFAETVWWLAQPLWSRDGNDRRTEHYSRHVISRLERESQSTYDMSWGRDSHELVVRYGYPTRWSREQSSHVDLSSMRIIGHEPAPAFEFVPDDSAIVSPRAAPSDAWTFRRPDASSRYAPPYARAFVPLVAHVSRFARGDSMLLVAVGEVQGDTVLQSDSLEASLVVASSPSEPRSIARLTALRRRATVHMTVRAESALVSVEMRDSSRREVGRARLGLSPPPSLDDSGVLMSDLLLFEEPQADDEGIEKVLSRATTAMAIPRGSRVGIYWELTRSAASGDTITYTLTVTPRSAGLLRRMANKVGLGSLPAPVHMSFTEPLGASERVSRVLTADLATLTPGHYDLRVRAETLTGTMSESVRAIRIVQTR